MHRFSVIVPLLGDSRSFEDSLASLLRYRPPQCQIIVVHDGNYDDPHRLGDEVVYVTSPQRPQLTRFFNCGLRSADGQFIALIRPGIEVDEGWHEPVVDAFRDPRVGSVAPAIVSASKPTRLVTAGVSVDFGYCRRLEGVNSRLAPRNIGRLSPLGPSSWMAVYRHALLKLLGTCDERLEPHYIDLDLALAANRLGYTCDFAPDWVVSIDRPTSILRELQTPHGMSAQRAQRRHARQSWMASVCRSVVAGACELIKSPLHGWHLEHLLGRFQAWRIADIDRHYADRLQSIAARRNWAEADALADPYWPDIQSTNRAA